MDSTTITTGESVFSFAAISAMPLESLDVEKLSPPGVMATSRRSFDTSIPTYTPIDFPLVLRKVPGLALPCGSEL